MFHFPAQRWIKADTRYVFRHYDTSLPQYDDCPEQRNEELLSKKRLYEYAVNFSGAPAQVKKLPEDESFSDSYKWDIVVNKMNLLKESRVLSAVSGVREYFESFGDLKKLYRQTSTMGVPISMRNWTNDLWFAIQRLQGCNPVLLALATRIPPNLNVDPDVVKELLGGLSLDSAVKAQRIFIVDLKILGNLPCPEGRKVCSPIALFYLDEKRQDLLPLCIQLFQIPSGDNPVFYPTDPPYAWLLAKMWYNNADAAYHQSCTHLGFTHLMMEGIAVCTHRNLSPSHPLFKLLAPHFLFLLAINTRGLQKLINPGGWVDKTTTMGCNGMFEIVKRGVKAWRLDVHAVPAVEIARRGVLDKTVLPYYPYRDDAVAVYEAIEKYVKSMVEHFYGFS
ncbi:hypothetical protein RvY_05650-2 [Ramazzottius varieornatus]|uniref:Lipoxygenase domain-containing protein n=1 Tax=Ramazzottius varieornatus TaxID=947166 RepID=A0A1D1V1D0_RAMVA|nr:hypothetical protein RvY_05650-2 [Ramazzottius varieornatus]